MIPVLVCFLRRISFVVFLFIFHWRRAQLTYEELKHVVKGYGFEFLSESWHDCTYTRTETSMMWTTYR